MARMRFDYVFSFFSCFLWLVGAADRDSTVDSADGKSGFDEVIRRLNETNALPPTLIHYPRSGDGSQDTASSYDFIVDLTRPTDILRGLGAYPVTFPRGRENYQSKIRHDRDAPARFIVNVVGRYNVGKTFVLKLLANVNLGHSFVERTNGISVSLPHPSETNDAPLALIDTAGTRTPVEYDAEHFRRRSFERQVSDSFIQEIAFNSAELFVLVVNQLTLDDQLYLKALTKRLEVRRTLLSSSSPLAEELLSPLEKRSHDTRYSTEGPDYSQLLQFAQQC